MLPLYFLFIIQLFMKKIRAAVVGFGNVGRCAIQALETAEDFEIAGVVRRAGSVEGYKTVGDIGQLEGVDVAIVCSPSRLVGGVAEKILAQGICTVDSFDIHSGIVGLREQLGRAAVAGGATAVLSSGWDPGTDSVVRALLEACAPVGQSYTNFGPGMSMGHSVAARAVEGVKDALSVTVPVGEGRHRREVYVEVMPGCRFEDVAAAVKADPYFAKDETRVEQVSDVCSLVDVHHGVRLVREGASGVTDGQKFEFSMRINNPALTAQVLVSSARAAVRMRARGEVGAFTLVEVPVVDLLPGSREENIARLV